MIPPTWSKVLQVFDLHNSLFYVFDWRETCHVFNMLLNNRLKYRLHLKNITSQLAIVLLADSFEI
jgi:hypothetical protein